MKKYAAEVAGTFLLVFFGTGTGIVNQQTGGMVTHAGVSLAWGLAVMGMIFCFGKISGAHLNPAVSIAFVIAKRFKLALLPGYVISQLIGALLASFTLKLLFPTNILLGATMPSGSEMQSFILELLLTFALMLVIMLVAHGSKERGKIAAVAIGAVVGLEAFFAGPICGASMNPARSIAPAMASGHLEHLWVYIAAPIVGAMLAIPVWYWVSKGKQNV